MDITTLHPSNSTLPPPPPPHIVWGYGLLIVTIINVASCIGVIMNPLSKQRWYRGLLLFMVALAVGVLAGSSLLFLLSGALALDTMDWDYRRNYLIKITVVLSAVFAFFNFETLLKIALRAFMNWRREKNEKLHHERHNGISRTYISSEKGVEVSATDQTSEEQVETTDGTSDNDDEPCFNELPVSNILHHHPRTVVSEATNVSTDVPEDIVGNYIQDVIGKASQIEPIPVHTKEKAEKDPETGTKELRCGWLFDVKPVAWMIIFGDGIHNFLDGLTIGASIAQSLSIGVSVSIAVLAEELPHEIGDLAVLLRTGLSIWKALLLNFLSACLCYIGFAIGALLGEFEEASLIIYALAAGLFMYIALADLMPEISPEVDGFGHSHEETVESRQRSDTVCTYRRNSSSMKTIFTHLAIADSGMILGYFLMALLAVYAKDLEEYIQEHM